jgi:hypothetical protein
MNADDFKNDQPHGAPISWGKDDDPLIELKCCVSVVAVTFGPLLSNLSAAIGGHRRFHEFCFSTNQFFSF